jgi:hypothetical protein
MKKIIYSAVAAAAIGISGAACGGSSHPSAAPSPVLNCPYVLKNDGNTVQQDIHIVVTDQQQQDQTQTENWVVPLDGSLTSQGNDLQTLLNGFLNGPKSSPFPTDVNNFQSDAQTFLGDQNSGLAPGWPKEYSNLRTDIYALGKDCPS